ncbi:hypothetical protein SAMN05661080_04113 [Modestobacter sp. DSM 44400]|uniref:DUF7482 domain-containing protein n=1 Tax=Modestobacter sp. DSM 44400 TaxID=1550230 RepID=UPI00089C5CD1|nr:hypothetical protein [Modestobacter sp. DSM 44400]SDY63557.1 hypothetical protein SAMN05661080_04113 [Modestobacter sp. DSM 44400]
MPTRQDVAVSHPMATGTAQPGGELGPAGPPPAARTRNAARAHRVRLLTGVAALTVLLVTACGATTQSQAPQPSQPAAGASSAGAAPSAEPPSVFAWYANKDIRFAHTEVSDQKIADLLTGKKNSPVVYVPELAKVPPEATSPVYIFSNGIQPEHRGPLGFQGDVFPTAPGDPGYSPLRALNLVTWKDGASPRQLTSAADVLAAQQAGELTLQQPGIIINMPFLQWPTGHR